MNEGEHHHADSFYLYDDVTVFFYSCHASFISLKGTSDDSDSLVFLEICFCEYLTSGGVGCCEEAEKGYG